MKVVFSSYLDPEFEGAALELAGWGITLSKVNLIKFSNHFTILGR